MYLMLYKVDTVMFNPMDDVLGSMKGVSVVDAVVAYDCSYTHKTYLLLVRNALFIPTMIYPHLPSFILWKVGIDV